MKNREIVESIEALAIEYKDYKDGGNALIKKLAFMIESTTDDEKTKLFDFFLSEIQYNDNKLWSLCLETLVEMNMVSLAAKLENIYIVEQRTKDDIWKFELINSMLKLQYKSNIYTNYIKTLIIEKPGNGYFLLIYYSSINPDIALNILSDFYAKYLDSDKKIQVFVKSRLNFLFEYILKNSIHFVPKLVQVTSKKNKKAGLFLKKIFVEYLQSEQCYNFNLKKQIINQLS